MKGKFGDLFDLSFLLDTKLKRVNYSYIVNYLPRKVLIC